MEQKRDWVKYLDKADEKSQTEALLVHMRKEFELRAFGDDAFPEGVWGEIRAFLDYDRLGVPLAGGAVIIEALRFMRSRPVEFEKFVWDNRQAFIAEELCSPENRLALVGQVRPCYQVNDKCLECHGL